jgi:hypothetical protein
MGRYAVADAQRAQRFVAKQGNIAYSSGVTSNLAVSQTDYLTQLWLTSNQQVTTTNSTPVVAGYGAYGALGNLQVRVNGGRAPFALPGYHANEYLKAWNNDYVDALVANTVTQSTTNNWKNHIRIPLTTDPFSDKGAWYTGDTALNLTFSLTMSAVATVLSTVGSATIIGSWDLWSEKYAAPQPDEPFGWLDQISYYKQTEIYLSGGVLSNGTSSFTLETDQDFLRIGLIFYTGSNADSTFAPANALQTGISLIVNDKFKIFDTVDEQTMRLEQLNDYYASSTTTLNVANGSIWLDFARFRIPTRDEILPTDPDQVKRLQLQIVSTSSSNKVDIITDTVVDSQFAEKWARSAKQKGTLK